MSRHWIVLAVIAAAGLMVSSIVLAQGAGQLPLVQLGSDVKGVLKQSQPNGDMELDAAGKQVFVRIDPKSKVTAISGTAEMSFLAPMMFVKILECEANALGEVKDPLKKLTILEPSDTETPSFYSEDPTAVSPTKKATKEEMAAFKKYFVRGTIRKIDDDELTIQAEKTLVKAKVAPDAKIDVQSGQRAHLSFAKPGDDVVVKQGKEVQVPKQPAPQGGQTAPKTPPKTNSKQAASTPSPDARYIIAEWIEVTAKSPLVGKKKPGAK